MISREHSSPLLFRVFSPTSAEESAAVAVPPLPDTLKGNGFLHFADRNHAEGIWGQDNPLNYEEFQVSRGKFTGEERASLVLRNETASPGRRIRAIIRFPFEFCLPRDGRGKGNGEGENFSQKLTLSQSELNSY